MGDQAMKALPPTSHAHTVIYALSEASPLTLTTLQSCTINQTSSQTQEPVRDILQSSHTMVKTMKYHHVYSAARKKDQWEASVSIAFTLTFPCIDYTLIGSMLPLILSRRLKKHHSLPSVYSRSTSRSKKGW